MSSQRGNTQRSRAQKHQNSRAFNNSLHDTSQRTKTVNQLDFGGLCQRCKDIMEWKVKYKKYKQPSQPRKCVRCDRRCIGNAYFTVCGQCGRQRSECQKCGQQRDLTPVAAPGSGGGGGASTAAVAASLEAQMLQLRERDRRTFLRLLAAEQFTTSAQAAAWIRHRLGGDGDDEYDEDDEDGEDEDENEEEDDEDATDSGAQRPHRVNDPRGG